MDFDKVIFTDEFVADEEICSNCGCFEMPRVGYNEKEDLLKFECPECGAVYVEDSNYKITMIRGEKREWRKYLAENLNFPFKAVVAEASDQEVFGVGSPGPIRYNDKLNVFSIDFEHDLYGVLALVKKGSKTYSFPIVDLEAEDKKSSNYRILVGYATWFANCR